MMFNKIAVIASLLFFLFGTNVFAHSHLEESTPINGTVLTESFHDMTTFTVAAAINKKVNLGDSAAEALKNSTSENAGVLTKKTKTVEPSFKDYVVPVSVGLLFVLGFGSYWLIYRRKHA